MISIMQPTYLPWAGYFNLISQVDTFVYLDNVQFERRSWQSRNRILLNGKEYYLSIPIKKVDRNTLIYDIQTSSDYLKWQKQHWSLLQKAYLKTNFGMEILNILEKHYIYQGVANISNFNIAIISDIAKALGLATNFICASELKGIGFRSERLISICNIIGTDTYLSPLGARNYLIEDNFEEKSGITLRFQDFEPLPYTQYYSDKFISHLSIIDVIANIGLKATKRYIKG